ncbi:phage tail protein [Streptomyces sp. H27-D2]|uniref:phage tail protein n=1 Tax=Streptomyces sp. H27-D2 TaxID=3046304 RepID=UPI002DBC3F84|nr:phage tail protein [Streptomyces sp. H27-D2]MEC4017980.1 phage tail protein [Streptomyces sp. H27-D2]
MRAQQGNVRAETVDDWLETVAALPLLVPGSRSLRALVPESYRQGDFADRFMAGFDDTLTPVIEALDCLDAYFNPRTAPAGFLEWMLQWTGADLPVAVSCTGRRNALLLGSRLHGLRGTRAGIELLVSEVLGGRVEIADPGGTRGSPWPEAWPTVGDRPTWAGVRIVLPLATDRATGAAEEIERMVRDWIPAHIDCRISVVDGTVRQTAAPEAVI